MSDFEDELKQDFLEESTDLLSNAESAFLRLDQERTNTTLFDEIFRLAHNLKGTSNAVGFEQLVEVTHTAENLILKIKEKEIEVTDNVVTVLLEFKDLITEMIEGLKSDFDAKFDTTEMEAKIKAATEGGGDAPVQVVSEEPPVVEAVDNFETASDTSEPISETQGSIEEPNLVAETSSSSEPSSGQSPSLEELTRMLDNPDIKDVPSASQFMDSAPVENSESAAAVEEPATPAEPQSLSSPKSEAKKTTPAVTKDSKPPAKADPAKSGAKSEVESIRVKLSRIDKLNNLVGELVILQTVLEQRRFQVIRDELSNKSIGQMNKLFKEVQEIAMSLRMIPLKTTFQKMSRIVRDTSKQLEKIVQLELVGDETEVDKTVLEHLSDPLVHIVRNAIDHGLELPATREERGKPKEGKIQIKASHEGSNLVIQVKDDGNGIDPEIIRTKAVEKGLIKPKTNLSDNELIQYIFHPGFSTKEQVTEVSGRGVGMDVVRTNIEQLGGEVTLESKLGQGSTLRIILPLTLAIIDGMVIKADEAKFVVPLDQVFEFKRIKNSEITQVTGGGNLFKLRGEVIPLFHVNSKLGLKVNDNPEKIVMIIRGLKFSFGVAVDDVLNQQQIVIKQLGEEIRNNKGFMGSAILGDGKPAFILDLIEFFKDDLATNDCYQQLLDGQSFAA